MFYNNFFAAFFTTIICVVRNELIAPIIHMNDNPWMLPSLFVIYLDFVLYFPLSLIAYRKNITFNQGMGILGIAALFFMNSIIRDYGVFYSASTSIVRKFATVFLSFLIYPKRINVAMGISVLMVFLGVFVSFTEKYFKKFKGKPQANPKPQIELPSIAITVRNQILKVT